MAIARVPCYLLFVLLILCVAESEAGDFCYKRRGTWSSTVTYCTYGCCGHSWDQYCCGTQVGLIVGGVLAGIMGICVLVAVICCCIKKQSHAGRVVHPSTASSRPAPNVTVVYTGTSGQYLGPYAGGVTQPMQPPPYKPHDNPPPAYTYSESAAYPPPANVYPPPGTDPAYPPMAPPPPPPGFNVEGSTAPPSTSLRQ